MAIFDKPKELLNSAKQKVNDSIGDETMDRIKEYGKTAAEVGSKAVSSAAEKISDAVKARQEEKNKVHKRTNATKTAKSNDWVETEAAVENKAQTKFVPATCPQCGASLEIEDGIDSFFCKYCGGKVVLTNQNAETLKAKIAVKKIEHREKMTDKVIGHLNERAARKAEEKEKQRKDANKAMMVLLAVMAVCFIMLFTMNGSQRRESRAEEAKLQQIVDQIEIDIENGDYDSALIKANSLYYTSGYSSDIKKKWDNTRESMVAMIVEAQNAEISRSAPAQFETPEESNVLEPPAPVQEEVLSDSTTELEDSFSGSENEPAVGTTDDSGIAYDEIAFAAITASDLSVRTMTDYSHAYTDTVYLGNNEEVTVTISASAVDLTKDDIVLIYDDTLLSAKMDEPSITEGRTVFIVYVTGKKAGKSSLAICTAHDLYLRGENASGFIVDIIKLDSAEGRVVYVTPTGEKYHFSKECAGENAIETTYWDVRAFDYQPCGKCAS